MPEALHLSPTAMTVLRGWYCPVPTFAIRADTITGVSVKYVTNQWHMTISYGASESRAWVFNTMDELNKALAPLHLTLTDIPWTTKD